MEQRSVSSSEEYQFSSLRAYRATESNLIRKNFWSTSAVNHGLNCSSWNFFFKPKGGQGRGLTGRRYLIQWEISKKFIVPLWKVEKIVLDYFNYQVYTNFWNWGIMNFGSLKKIRYPKNLRSWKKWIFYSTKVDLIRSRYSELLIYQSIQKFTEINGLNLIVLTGYNQF